MVPVNSFQMTAGPDGIDASMPLIVETRLDNGIRVVTAETDEGFASDVGVVQVKLLTGSALDGDMPGTARFTASMLTRGSGGRPMDQISEDLDGLGASIGVNAGGQSTDGSIMSLREDADRVLGYLAQALREPDFPEDQVDIVRRQMLAQLRQSENSTRAMANRLMRETIYPEGHPYHQRAGGTETSLNAIDRTTLVDFHERTLKPAGAIVSVAGGLSHDEAVALVEHHFGNWQGEPPPIDVPAAMASIQTTRVDDVLPGKTQSDIALGLPAIPRSHPDYYRLSIANLVLGLFGLFGRLGASVRERQGMAYYAYSRYEAGKSVGLWVANAGVAPDNVDRAVESIIAEVRTFLIEGPTQQEFGDAIGSVLGSVSLGLETSSSMASVASDIVYNDLGLDFLRRYREIITSVTPEEMVEAARQYIDPDRLIIAVVGPETGEATQAG